jgi:hypothetical protein
MKRSRPLKTLAIMLNMLSRFNVGYKQWYAGNARKNLAFLTTKSTNLYPVYTRNTHTNRSRKRSTPTNPEYANLLSGEAR